MGYGGDGRDQVKNSTQELFGYRYWYAWETARQWPTASIVLCRWRQEKKWEYHLIKYFQPDAGEIEPGAEYMIIERDERHANG